MLTSWPLCAPCSEPARRTLSGQWRNAGYRETHRCRDVTGGKRKKRKGAGAARSRKPPRSSIKRPPSIRTNYRAQASPIDPTRLAISWIRSPRSPGRYESAGDGPPFHSRPAGSHPTAKNQSRVGKGRPAGSIELRVSPSPSKIPYGGFSPVRLQMDRQWRPSTTSQRFKCRPHTPRDSVLYATAVATPRNT